jgi:hypothetical protein
MKPAENSFCQRTYIDFLFGLDGNQFQKKATSQKDFMGRALITINAPYALVQIMTIEQAGKL